MKKESTTTVILPNEEHSTHTRTFAYKAMKTVFARFGEYFKNGKE